MNGNAEKLICKEYERAFGNKGCYFYGRIGDKAIIRDIGRNWLRQKFRKYKYILTGGEFAQYLY